MLDIEDVENTKFVIFIHGFWRDAQRNYNRVNPIDKYLEANKDENDIIRTFIFAWKIPKHLDMIPMEGSHEQADKAGIFLEYLVHLMILKYGCKDISLIAHSMGTRTVCKAILKLNECYINNIKEKKGMKKLFAIDECKRKKLKVLLVAGEAEAEMLENTIKSKVVSHGIVHITNYYVNKRGFAGDIALQFTQLIGLNKATIGMKPVLAQKYNVVLN